MRKQVRFHLQATKSFPEGAPQREECHSDRGFDLACLRYDAEWIMEYECIGCYDVSETIGPRHRWDCPSNILRVHDRVFG